MLANLSSRHLFLSCEMNGALEKEEERKNDGFEK